MVLKNFEQYPIEQESVEKIKKEREKIINKIKNDKTIGKYVTEVWYGEKNFQYGKDPSECHNSFKDEREQKEKQEDKVKISRMGLKVMIVKNC